MEAAYGKTADYRDGLSSLGTPTADDYQGQYADTSNCEYEDTNSGTDTTPEKEWEFVVDPQKDKDYGGGRKPVDLLVLLYACCAVRRHEVANNNLDAVRWMD